MVCPACNSTKVGYQRDRVTNAPVIEDGKVLARCLNCGEVFIATEEEWDQYAGRSGFRRYIRIGITAVGAFVGLLLATLDWLTGFCVPWQIALGFATAFALLRPIEIVLQRTVVAPKRPDRAEALFVVVLYALLAAVFISVFIWVSAEKRRLAG